MGILHLLLTFASVAMADDAGFGDQQKAPPKGRPVRMIPVPQPVVCDEVPEKMLPQRYQWFPPLTPAMLRLAKKYPELQPETIRRNFCLGEEGEECEAKEEKRGGEELVEELEAVKFTGDEAKKEFHESVTEEKYEDSRDREAIVVQQGFSRKLRVVRLLYRVNDHDKFFENAEGIDLANKQAVESERLEYERLVEILTEIEEELLKNPSDQASISAIDFYLDHAKANLRNLQLIDCELGRMARTNREREDRMKAIISAIDPKSSQVTGEVKEEMTNPRPSEVTGYGAQAMSRNPAFVDREALSSFGELQEQVVLYEPPARDWWGDEEDSLFARVHKKYRQKDERGFFGKGPLD